MDIYQRAESLKSEIIGWRRHIHENPEGGPDQPETAAYIMEKLRSFGLAPQKLGGGVVAIIQGERPGKTILLRADMDALFMEELTELPFCSKRPGLHHACGHDMHTAMLLGAAQILCERKSELCGQVKLCFQPAEELGAGAMRMIKAGLLEAPDVDAAMGLHMAIATEHPAGTVAVSPGVTLASNDMFKITVYGRGSHGARPETAIDPINILCHIHSMLQTINSREIAPRETVVLTVGQIAGGQTPNSIPEEAFMRGTVRTLRREDQTLIKRRITEIAEKTAEAFGGRAQVEFEVEMSTTVNEEKLTLEMKTYLRELLGESKVAEMPTRMGAEDFSWVTARVPSMFAFLSGGSRDEGYVIGSHNPRVIYSEDCMPTGAAAYAQCALRWLEAHAGQ